MKNKPARPESPLKENLEGAGFETCPDGSSNPTMTSSSHRRFLDLSAFKRGISHGLGFIFTLGASALLAVAVTGTVNTFVNGNVMEASQLNTNFSSLKTAIEGITSSQWTTNGTSIYYNAGNVGIGTVSPSEKLDLGGGNIKMGYTIATANDAGLTGVVPVACPGGNAQRVLGGGCSPNATAVATSISCPYDWGGGVCTSNISNAWAWLCTFNTSNAGHKAYVICANIK